MSTPYFYILRHTFSGRLYAGSRYAKDCDPTELLQKDGYNTSSKIVHNLIERDGTGSFEIIRIDTYCDNLHPHDYETLFLQSIDAANNDVWLNCHNNVLSGWNTNTIKKAMLLKYGVENFSQLESTKEIKSKLMKKLTAEKKKAGTLNFQNSDIQRNIQLKLSQENRHNFSRESHKQYMSDKNKKMVEDGTHPFLGDMIQSATNKRKVEDGTHHFLGGEIQRRAQNKIVAEGKHHSQTAEFSKQQSQRQTQLVADGKHHLLSGDVQRRHNLYMCSRDIYLKVKQLYEEMNITKPKCLHRKPDSFLENKYIELMEIKNGA